MSVNIDSIRDVTEKTLNRTLGDHIFIPFDYSIQKTNLSTSWVNLIPVYNGRPFLTDFTGYTKYAIQVFWRKNGGTGRHDFRVIKDGNESHILITSEGFANGLLDEPSINELLNQDIPPEFENYRGRVRFQVKSSNGTDDPIHDATYLYLER